MLLSASSKLRIKLGHVLTIAMVWALFGLLDSVLTWCIAGSHYMEPLPSYNAGFDMAFTSVAYFIGGLTAGILLLFILQPRFRDRPFWLSFAVSVIAIGLFHVAISWFAYAYMFRFELDQPYFSPAVWDGATDYLTSPAHLRNVILLTMMTAGTVLYMRVNRRYGPGNLLSSFLGRYHRPREEERIFMFLDIRSSTSLAERLGHVQFHRMLDDFFRDVSDAILFTRGEVYQYVGDEVVVSWQIRRGLMDANCIRCFYEIRKTVRSQSARYMERYGIVPEFKAGLHLGIVTTGEIGEIKRDLVHSGDVLNTAARIQAKCNELGVDILLSADLRDRLVLIPAQLVVVNMGDYNLRGKQETITVYTLEERKRKREIRPAESLSSQQQD